MTGDDEDYQNDVSRMKGGLAEIDFDQRTPKQIEARDRKARKVSIKGKGERAQPKNSDERPRLKIEKHSPEKTVAELRGILGAAGGLYDRGKIVKMVDDQARGGSVAHVMTPAALVMATHQASRPYLEKVQGDSIEEVDAALPHQIAVMYQDWRDWGLPPLNGIAAAPFLGEDGSIRTAQGYDSAGCDVVGSRGHRPAVDGCAGPHRDDAATAKGDGAAGSQCDDSAAAEGDIAASAKGDVAAGAKSDGAGIAESGSGGSAAAAMDVLVI